MVSEPSGRQRAGSKAAMAGCTSMLSAQGDLLLPTVVVVLVATSSKERAKQMIMILYCRTASTAAARPPATSQSMCVDAAVAAKNIWLQACIVTVTAAAVAA